MFKIRSFLLLIFVGLSACAVTATPVSTVGNLIPTMTQGVAYTQTFTQTLTQTETSTPTLLGNPWITKEFERLDCWNTAKTQYDTNQCSGKQEELSYQFVVNLVNVLKQKLSPEEQDTLSNVQVNWENYRKTDCKFYMDLYNGGSMAPMVYELCLYHHNIERINQLDEYLCNYYSMTDYCIIYQQ